MAIDQDSFRFRNDDGSEASASWMDSVNVTVVSEDTNFDFRIRFLIQADAPENITSPQLQYKLNAGAWTDVTDVSNVVRAVSSANFSDDDFTTQQLGSATFNSGRMDDVDGSTSGVTIGTGEETELEFMCRMFEAGVSDGDTVSLRVTDGGTALDTYTNEAQIDVSGSAPPPETFPPAKFPRRSRSRVVPSQRRIASGVVFLSDYDEQITPDKWDSVEPRRRMRQRTRQPGMSLLVEVVPEVLPVDHGWEVPPDTRRNRHRRRLSQRRMAGVRPLEQVITVESVTLLGSLRSEPTQLIDEMIAESTELGAMGPNLEGRL